MDSLRGMTKKCLIDPLVIPPFVLHYLSLATHCLAYCCLGISLARSCFSATLVAHCQSSCSYLCVSLTSCFRVMSAGFVQSLIREDECLDWASGNIFVGVFCKCLQINNLTQTPAFLAMHASELKR